MAVTIVDGRTRTPLADVVLKAWVEGRAVEHRTDESGRARIARLARVVEAHHPGYVQVHHQITSEERDAGRGVLRLTAGADVMVRVTDSVGRPLPLQDVDLEHVRPDAERPPFLTYRSERTDELGAATFEQVAAGRWKLSVNGTARGYEMSDPRTITVEAGVPQKVYVPLRATNGNEYVSGFVKEPWSDDLRIKVEDRNNWQLVHPDGLFVLRGKGTDMFRIRLELLSERRETVRAGSWHEVRNGTHGVEIRW